MLRLFLRYHEGQIRRYFKSGRPAKLITVFLFLAVLAGVAYAIYAFFKWEFKLVAFDEYLRGALPLFLNEILFLVVFILVFFSAFVTGLFSLFRGQDDTWIVASPKFRSIFWYTYIRVFLSSMWPILVVALPAFLGFRDSYHIGISGIVLSLVSMVFLVGFAVSLGLFVILACAQILSLLGSVFRKRFLTLGRVVLFVVVILACAAFFMWNRVGTGDIVKIFAPVDSAWKLSRTDVILDRFSVFPSHLSALTLFDLQIQNNYAALASVASLFGLFLASFIWIWVASFFYLPLWQVLQEGRLQAKTVSRGIAKGPVRFPRYLKSPLGALFEKEAMVHVREMKNVLWFGFLFFLWLIQVSLGFFIRRNMLQYQATLDTTSILIETLQIAIAAYFVSSFVLRFAFPSFSTERKTAWILDTAPLKTKDIFWAKLFFYAASFLAMGLALGVVNSFIVNVALENALLFLFVIALMTLFITVFGMALGTIFPNFETDDPQVLSTSLAGLSFIFGSLAYGGVGASMFYLFLAKGMFFGLAGFILLTLLGIALLISWALRSLDTFEFVKNFE